MAESKSVLVLYKDFCRVVQLDSTFPSEKESLLAGIRVVFGDRIAAGDRLTLQKKDESWGGLFVDFFGDEIEDRSVFKVIVEPVKVGM